MEQENNGLLNLFSKLTKVLNNGEQSAPKKETITPPPTQKKAKALIDFIATHNARKNTIISNLKKDD